MTYNQFKQKIQDEINSFPMFFAFNDEQFIKGKEKLGITDNKELLNIGAGGFIRKADRQRFTDLFKSQAKHRKEFLKDRNNLKESLLYELGNYEYCISYDETPALEALGLKPNKLTDLQKEVLKEVKQEYLVQCSY